MTEKTKDFKSIEQGHTEGTFSLPFKIPTLCLDWGKPQTPKSKSKGKMALASLVSSQKQKHTIVKIFMKSDAKKSGFSEGRKSNFHCVARRHSLITFFEKQKKGKVNLLCLFTFAGQNAPIGLNGKVRPSGISSWLKKPRQILLVCFPIGRLLHPL